MKAKLSSVPIEDWRSSVLKIDGFSSVAKPSLNGCWIISTSTDSLPVTGPSGSGKSSVAQAGILPRLDDGRTRYQIFTPGERPLEELAFALYRGFPPGEAPATESLQERLRQSDEALHLIVRELCHAAGLKRFVLLADQFEELFTLAVDPEEQERFVANLLGAVDRSESVWMILTLRSDFLGHCTTYPDLSLFVQEHFFQVGPMSPEELRSTIVEPARLVGLHLEDALVEEMLADVESSPAELPLLEHALLELFRRHERNHLSLSSYVQIGRIAGALTRRAEEMFQESDEEGQEILRKVFVFGLVKVGEGTEDTRRRARREELLAIGRDSQRTEKLLSRWTDARLLTTTTDEERQLHHVEVAHEALIRRWSRLRNWMDEDREKVRQIGVLRREAEEWQGQDYNKDYLLTGVRLTQARELMERDVQSLTELERRFVSAAYARAGRRILSLAALVAVAIAIAIFWVYDVNKNRIAAQQSRDSAQRQLSLSYWVESGEQKRKGRFLNALHFVSEAIAANLDGGIRRNQSIAAEGYRPRWGLEHYLSHEGPVGGAVFNGDETRVLSWSWDKTARLWDAATGEQIGPSLTHEGAVLGAVFNGDETRVLSWSDDKTARLWDVVTGEQIGPSLTHEGPVGGAVFNGDSTPRALLERGQDYATLGHGRADRTVTHP